MASTRSINITSTKPSNLQCVFLHVDIDTVYSDSICLCNCPGKFSGEADGYSLLQGLWPVQKSIVHKLTQIRFPMSSRSRAPSSWTPHPIKMTEAHGLNLAMTRPRAANVW